jgi:hypothetical protein
LPPTHSKKVDPGQVAARPGKAGDQTNFDRVIADAEDDGDRGGCCLRSQRRRRGASNDHGDTSPNKIDRQRRQSIDLILGPTVFDGDVFALDIAVIIQALAKCGQNNVRKRARLAVEEPNHRHRRLLRARRERPRGRRAAKQSDENATFHSITSSARTSTDGGIINPRDFAALSLMTSSSLVGNSTGKSPGLAPLRILFTYVAAR